LRYFDPGPLRGFGQFYTGENKGEYISQVGLFYNGIAESEVTWGLIQDDIILPGIGMIF
jgi:hypothetical protein